MNADEMFQKFHFLCISSEKCNQKGIISTAMNQKRNVQFGCCMCICVFFSSHLASVPVHMFSMHRRDSAWLRQTVWCICFGFIALEPMRCGLKKMLDIITRTNSKNKMAQRLLFLWLLILLKLLAFIYRISVVYCKSQ